MMVGGLFRGPLTMLIINGVEMPPLSSFEWQLMDVSAGESGRTDDALMHKNTVAKKRKLLVSWVRLDFADASRIIQAVSSDEYFPVTYPDYLDGNLQAERVFYVGDRTVPVKAFRMDDPTWQFTDTISFDLIER